MAKTKQSRKPIPFPEWQRRTGCLLRLEDQGRSVRLDPATFGIQSRDRTWNLFARDLISANSPQLEAVAVTPILEPEPDQICVCLRPGGTIGSIPLRSPTTRKVIGGLVVRPRFGWNDIGPLLQEIGWRASPKLLRFPLVPGAAKEVPPWVLAGPIIERFRALLDEITPAFHWQDEPRQSPRGQILWARYLNEHLPAGKFHELPCRFPDLGPDMLLRGMIRWGIEVVKRSLAGWVATDPIARRLTELAAELLFKIADAKSIIPTKTQLDSIVLMKGLPSFALQRGMQALGWLVDERGLAGTAQSDGLAWSLPMYELFERWVEHLVRHWARGIGAQVRSGRTHETLIPIRWKRVGASSLNSLVPDLIVQQGPRTWIIDAKYKGHFEELDEHRWAELGDELRQEHRHDLHQVLAYASVFGGEHVTTVLAYPMRLHTWQSLAERTSTVTSATINTGTRRLTIALIGLPLQMPRPDLFGHFLECWNALNPIDEL